MSNIQEDRQHRGDDGKNDSEKPHYLSNNDYTTIAKSPHLFRGTDTLAVNDLHWFTTADHLVTAAKCAGVVLTRKDVMFAEHKVNGKTKGSVVIHCHSEDAASKIAYWFHHNDFQGKKLSPTFVNPTAGNPFKPAAPTSSGPRPVLNTQVLLSHGPTNAHGGVNFNRVRPARMAQHNQVYPVPHNVGMGWPSGFVPKSKAYGAGEPVIPYGSVGFDGRAVWTGQPMPLLEPQATPFFPSGGYTSEYA